MTRFGEWRRCPDCGRQVWIGVFAETIICRCGAWFHPEQAAPLGSVK